MDDNQQPIPFLPDGYFEYFECRTCRNTPCGDVRWGFLKLGQYKLVSRQYYSMGDCVFSEQSYKNVADYLRSLVWLDLSYLFSSVTYWLTPMERNHYDFNLFLDSCTDRHGMIEYLIHLLKNRVIVAIGLPYDFEENEKIKRWYYALKPQPQNIGERRLAAVDDLSAPAATDEMAQEKQKPLQLTNPRWEHKDAQNKKDSPDIASEGDIVLLKVDCEGVPAQAPVKFKLNDTVDNSKKVIITVSGKHVEGLATAEWAVKFPAQASGKRKMTLAFCGDFKDKESDKATVKIMKAAKYTFSA